MRHDTMDFFSPLYHHFLPLFQIFLHVPSRIGNRAFCHLLRRYRPGRRLWPHIDDVVGGLDHVQVVLDDHHRVSALRQTAQDLHQLVNIRKMKSRGGLVQDINGLSVPLLESSVASLILWASPPESSGGRLP